MYTFTKSHHALPGDCGWSKGLINPIVDCVMRRIEQMVGLCCRAQERRRAPGPLTVFFFPPVSQLRSLEKIRKRGVLKVEPTGRARLAAGSGGHLFSRAVAHKDQRYWEWWGSSPCRHLSQ